MSKKSLEEIFDFIAKKAKEKTDTSLSKVVESKKLFSPFNNLIEGLKAVNGLNSCYEQNLKNVEFAHITYYDHAVLKIILNYKNQFITIELTDQDNDDTFEINNRRVNIQTTLQRALEKITEGLASKAWQQKTEIMKLLTIAEQEINDMFPDNAPAPKENHIA